MLAFCRGRGVGLLFFLFFWRAVERMAQQVRLDGFLRQSLASSAVLEDLEEGFEDGKMRTYRYRGEEFSICRALQEREVDRARRDLALDRIAMRIVGSAGGYPSVYQPTPSEFRGGYSRRRQLLASVEDVAFDMEGKLMAIASSDGRLEIHEFDAISSGSQDTRRVMLDTGQTSHRLLPNPISFLSLLTSDAIQNENTLLALHLSCRKNYPRRNNFPLHSTVISLLKSSLS